MTTLTSRILLLIVSIFLTASLAAKAQDCYTCNANLDSLISSVEENYVGFSDKVPPEHRRSYQLFKDSLKSRSLDTDFECFFLLKAYILYFNDPHLAFTIGTVDGGPVDTTLIKNIFKNVPAKRITEKDVMNYLNTNKNDSIEGIWENPSLPYKVAIIKDSGTRDRYTGFTLGGDNLYWYQGQIKMEIARQKSNYTTTYYRNDHTPDTRSTRLAPGTLNITGYSPWYQIYPLRPCKAAAGRSRNLLSFRILSDSACMMSIPDFNIASKKQIDSIIGENIKTISSSKYLLIDLRNNGGGSLLSADGLFALTSSGSFVEDGFIVRSSKDNIKTYRKHAGNTDFSTEARQAFLEIADKMETHGNGNVQISGPDTISITQTPLRYPEQIGLLINEGTASAAELFTLRSKQSSKVTVLGNRSRGALDYTEGDVKTLGCPYFIYSCPIGMSDHTVTPYIDNVGIQPDVSIPDATSDWETYALKCLTESDAIKRKNTKP